MKNAHIDALQELAGREFPMEIRLKAGELLGMVVDHSIKKGEETPVDIGNRREVSFYPSAGGHCQNFIKENFRPLSR